MVSPEISIIMRSKNSDWVIGSALAALFSQSFKDFELLVVDSGSTDRTLEIVNEYPCRLIEIEPKDYYPGTVLNNAIKLCKSDLIVFINSDSVLLGPDSLGCLVRRLKQTDVHAVFGRQIPRPEAETWVRQEYAQSFPETGNAPHWIKMSLPLAGLRKSVWESHPFYTDAWASEDTEWGHWAQEHGFNVEYEPEALTMHSHNYTLKEMYGRRFVEGEADVFIYGCTLNLLRIFQRWAKAVVKDVLVYLSQSDWWGLASVIPRRSVYYWAYFKGNQLGWHRRRTGNADAGLGQTVVLNSQ